MRGKVRKMSQQMILNWRIMVAVVFYGEKCNDGVWAGLEKTEIGSKEIN